MEYAAPIRDMRFALEEIAGLTALTDAGLFPDLSPDLVEAILNESGKFAGDVLSPLNSVGDTNGAKLENGIVRTAPGFSDAYGKFIEAGWGGISCNPDYGGQGLPYALAIACQEMIHASNMSFALCPMLTASAIDAVEAHGTQEQKDLYLAKLVSGEWSGTMNLTEPQAGSDVGALRTKAEPQGDGTYLIRGNKIYITYGDHDMAENIIHFVLARLPDAPAGTRGISLFLVPKIMVNGDGSLGVHNDVKPVSLEHKLGIHASPTCVMAYGENEGAVGYLVGAENHGLACMFTMMNGARLCVGLQGTAISERAYQRALAFSQERRQGKPWARRKEKIESLPIIEHADVRRMLMTMKAYTEATRAICYANAVATDTVQHHPDEAVRTKAKEREELLTPISKAFSTDVGCEVASIGIQVHGGMGFIEETGAAQHFRDARIAPIYEGTNGIQAQDLATRKLGLNGGGAVKDFVAEAQACATELAGSNDGRLHKIGRHLGDGVAALKEASDWMLGRLKEDPQDCLAGATPYLRLFGTVAGGHYLGRGALAAKRHQDNGSGGDSFYSTKIAIAEFYALNILPQSTGLVSAVTIGAEPLFELSPDQLAG